MNALEKVVRAQVDVCLQKRRGGSARQWDTRFHMMPPIGWLIGGIDFKDLKYDLPVNPLNEGGEPVSIAYGNFLQTCIDFIIIAFCVFMLVRLIMKLSRKKKEAAQPKAPAEPSEEVKLLREIRDALQK